MRSFTRAENTAPNSFKRESLIGSKKRVRSNFMFKSFFNFNRLMTVCGALLIFNCGGFAQERNYKTFTPEDGSWSILAPGEMKVDPSAGEKLGTKGGYSYTDSTGFFAVTYENSPKYLVTFNKPFINSHYRKIRRSFVKSSNGLLLRDIKFEKNGEKGRDFMVKIPDGTVLDSEGRMQTRFRTGRFRIFFHGNRCYLLIAVLPESEINAFAVDNYFDSFTAK